MDDVILGYFIYANSTAHANWVEFGTSGERVNRPRLAIQTISIGFVLQ